MTSGWGGSSILNTKIRWKWGRGLRRLVSYNKNRKVIINVTQEIINVEKGSGKFPGGPGAFKEHSENAWKIQNSRYRKRKKEEADTKFLFGEERACGKQAPNWRVFQPPSSPPQLSTTTRVILLREEILHQLYNLVLYLIICRAFKHPRWFW